MIRPLFVTEIARQIVQDRLDAAERRRRARLPALEGPITLRPSTTDDALALSRLAALDDRRLPSGPFLLAEVAGELVAALTLHSEQVLADPFRPTADVVRLLRFQRARQLGA